jgi:hypothetical protein
MAKLTVWIAVRTDDSEAYSLIGKTKKEVVEQLKTAFGDYEPVVKQEIYYTDAFDLFKWLTGEGGGRNQTYLNK